MTEAIHQLIPEPEAARILGLSVHTLRGRRAKCQPPRYLKLGKSVRYRLSDLQEFMDSCQVRVQEVA
jgi:predicted DNA-binding transcriptional regulator AlpA